MFNIADFKANLFRHGTIRNSLFNVIFTKPNADPGDIRELTTRCEATTLPGRNISTVEHTYHGSTIKYPYQSTMTDVDLSIILSHDMYEKEFFEKWVDDIVGNYRQLKNAPSTTRYDLKYFNTYVGETHIRQFDEVGNLVYNTTLHEAFPISIGNISLTWENGSEILKLPITLSYTIFSNELIRA